MTAAEDKEERLRLSGTRIELEELLQLPVDVAYEGLLTDDVSESVRKKLITLRAGPSRTACSNLRNPLALGRTTVLGVMWCTKGTLPTELALSQQHTVDRMSDVHPTAVTDNGDPVGIIAGIRISACTGIVCSRPSLPGTNHQPLEGRLQPQARRWSTDQDMSFDKTRSNGRQNRTNYSTNRDQMYDKTGVL